MVGVVPALRGLGEPVLDISSVLQDKTLAPGTVGLVLSSPWSLAAAVDGETTTCWPAECNSGGTGFAEGTGRGVMAYIGA